MNESSLKKRAINATAWTLGGFGFSRVVRLANHLVLAWLLAPQIFGLMALVKVFSQGLEMFSDIGIRPSIIQNKRGSEPVFLNTAWTIQIIRGCGLWIITCLLAWPFAWWYARNDPAAWQLVILLPVTGLSALIRGFTSTTMATLNKELRFGRITMIELGVQAISLVVMVVWALIHPTIWAMVAGVLSSAFAGMIISHFLVPGHRVRFAWDKECRDELFKFGKWVFLSTTFTFLALNMDKLALGKILTLTELGIYSIAYVFAYMALSIASRMSSSVMFPIYAKLQNQPERLMAMAIKTREVALWGGGAVCICLAVGAPLFFETLWDPRYHGAGQIAQWMSVYIWSMIIMYSMDRIPLALGNSRATFLANIVQTGGIATAAAGYFLAGLPGFIVGLAGGPLASHLFLLKYIPTGRGEMLWQSIRFTIMACMVGVSAVLFTNWVREVTAAPIWIGSVVLLSLVPLAASAWVAYQRVWQVERVST